MVSIGYFSRVGLYEIYFPSSWIRWACNHLPFCPDLLLVSTILLFSKNGAIGELDYSFSLVLNHLTHGYCTLPLLPSTIQHWKDQNFSRASTDLGQLICQPRYSLWSKCNNTQLWKKQSKSVDFFFSRKFRFNYT